MAVHPRPCALSGKARLKRFSAAGTFCANQGTTPICRLPACVASYAHSSRGNDMAVSSIIRVREKLVVGLIALFVATAVYTFFGFAWTFKSAVESAQRFKHPFSRGL